MQENCHIMSQSQPHSCIDGPSFGNSMMLQQHVCYIRMFAVSVACQPVYSCVSWMGVHHSIDALATLSGNLPQCIYKQ